MIYTAFRQELLSGSSDKGAVTCVIINIRIIGKYI